MLRSRCEVVRRNSERIPATSHKSLGYTFSDLAKRSQQLKSLNILPWQYLFTTKHRVKLLYNSVARHWFPSLIILLFYMYTMSENGIHYTPLCWLIFTESPAVVARPREVLCHLKSSRLLYTAVAQLRWRTEVGVAAGRSKPGHAK